MFHLLFEIETIVTKQTFHRAYRILEILLNSLARTASNPYPMANTEICRKLFRPISEVIFLPD